MSPHLSLYEDIYSNGASASLSPAPRMIFVVYGEILISGRRLGEGETWHGVGAALVRACDAGASVWRWDLTEGTSLSLASDGVRSLAKILASLETLPKGDLLMRGDSVAFPPGGQALTHVHQGPGIRCLIEGGIRIDTRGRSTAYGPGGAWFEGGPDAVFAQAALGSADSVYPRNDPSHGVARKDFNPIRQRGRQGSATFAELQALCRRSDRIHLGPR